MTKVKAIYKPENRIVFVIKEFEGFWTDGKDTYTEKSLDFLHLPKKENNG